VVLGSQKVVSGSPDGGVRFSDGGVRFSDGGVRFWIFG